MRKKLVNVFERSLYCAAWAITPSVFYSNWYNVMTLDSIGCFSDLETYMEQVCRDIVIYERYTDNRVVLYFRNRGDMAVVKLKYQ
jgi:hypothetical protein